MSGQRVRYLDAINQQYGQTSVETERGASMNSKVGRLIEKYDLTGMDDQLIDFWTSDDEDNRSLRELADYFNREILRAAMNEAGMTTLDGEIENTYRLLTAEDVSTGVRTQAETTLERNGIDIETLIVIKTILCRSSTSRCLVR